MRKDPHFGWFEMPVGKYVPEIWFQNIGDSQTHYRGDSLIANLLHTSFMHYSAFLKMYGALGPENGKTYFSSQEDCESFLDILKYLYEEINTNGRTWLSVVYEFLNELDSALTQSAVEEESRTDYYLANAKTYWNQQTHQGIPWDINFTKKNVKDSNTGKMSYNPFKPGRSKKPTHYTFLNA